MLSIAGNNNQPYHYSLLFQSVKVNKKVRNLNLTMQVLKGALNLI